jgi:hypothetical protein
MTEQLVQAQDVDPTLFESSSPETLVTLTFSADLAIEHYGDHHEQTPDSAFFSNLGPADLASSNLLGAVTGSAFSDQGVLRSKIEITPSDSRIYTASSTVSFTDTFILQADNETGQSGTLPLEFAIAGRAPGTASTLASALSLTLIGGDNFQRTDPFSQPFVTGSDFDLTFTADDPLTTTLDIDFVFGESVTYGASLSLTLIGEGNLDFSDTLRLLNASVTNDKDELILDAKINSEAGIAYGKIGVIPEPSSTSLLILGAIGVLARRRRS